MLDEALKTKISQLVNHMHCYHEAIELKKIFAFKAYIF